MTDNKDDSVLNIDESSDFIDPVKSGINKAAADEESSKDQCGLCGKSLAHLTNPQRQVHANRCLDNVESDTNYLKSKDEWLQSLDCPLCSTTLIPGPWKSAHIKSCAKSHGISPAAMVQLIETQSKVAKVRLDKRMPHTKAAKPRKEPVKRRKDNLVPKTANEAEADLARALSLSLLESTSVSDVINNDEQQPSTSKAVPTKSGISTTIRQPTDNRVILDEELQTRILTLFSTHIHSPSKNKNSAINSFKPLPSKVPPLFSIPPEELERINSSTVFDDERREWQSAGSLSESLAPTRPAANFKNEATKSAGIEKKKDGVDDKYLAEKPCLVDEDLLLGNDGNNDSRRRSHSSLSQNEESDDSSAAFRMEVLSQQSACVYLGDEPLSHSPRDEIQFDSIPLQPILMDEEEEKPQDAKMKSPFFTTTPSPSTHSNLLSLPNPGAESATDSVCLLTAKNVTNDEILTATAKDYKEESISSSLDHYQSADFPSILSPPKQTENSSFNELTFEKKTDCSLSPNTKESDNGIIPASPNVYDDACVSSPVIDACVSSPVIEDCVSSPVIDACGSSPVIDACVSSPVIDDCVSSSSPVIDDCVSSPIVAVDDDECLSEIESECNVLDMAIFDDNAELTLETIKLNQSSSSSIHPHHEQKIESNRRSRTQMDDLTCSIEAAKKGSNDDLMTRMGTGSPSSPAKPSTGFCSTSPGRSPIAPTTNFIHSKPDRRRNPLLRKSLSQLCIPSSANWNRKEDGSEDDEDDRPSVGLTKLRRMLIVDSGGSPIRAPPSSSSDDNYKDEEIVNNKGNDSIGFNKPVVKSSSASSSTAAAEFNDDSLTDLLIADALSPRTSQKDSGQSLVAAAAASDSSPSSKPIVAEKTLPYTNMLTTTDDDCESTPSALSKLRAFFGRGGEGSMPEKHTTSSSSQILKQSPTALDRIPSSQAYPVTSFSPHLQNHTKVGRPSPRSLRFDEAIAKKREPPSKTEQTETTTKPPVGKKKKMKRSLSERKFDAITPKMKPDIKRIRGIEDLLGPGAKIIKTTDVTPMPLFAQMSTPEIKEALKENGIRPLPKKRAINMLKKVYEVTHPEVPVFLLDNETKDSGDDLDEPGQSSSAASSTADERESTAGSDHEDDYDTEENECMEESMDEKLSPKKASTEQHLAELGRELRRRPEFYKKILTFQVTRRFSYHQLQGERKVFVQYVLYEISSTTSICEQTKTITLEEIQSLADAMSLKISKNKLMDYLDEQHVVWTFAVKESKSGKPRRRYK